MQFPIESALIWFRI